VLLLRVTVYVNLKNKRLKGEIGLRVGSKKAVSNPSLLRRSSVGGRIDNKLKDEFRK